jgi:hypothetical protein
VRLGLATISSLAQRPWRRDAGFPAHAQSVAGVALNQACLPRYFLGARSKWIVGELRAGIDFCVERVAEFFGAAHLGEQVSNGHAKSFDPGVTDDSEDVGVSSNCQLRLKKLPGESQATDNLQDHLGTSVAHDATVKHRSIPVAFHGNLGCLSSQLHVESPSAHESFALAKFHFAIAPFPLKPHLTDLARNNNRLRGYL